MRYFDAPNFRLSARSPGARGFLRRGVTDFHRAIRYLRDLPSTNGSWRADDHRRVLPEHGGSSAAKHALLAVLAMEHGIPLRLVLGIYEIDAENTPGAEPILRAAKLRAVPDATCFLSYDGFELQLTPESGGRNAPAFLHREPITPWDIGEYRLAVFQRFLWKWTQARGLEMGFAWRVREQCLDASLRHRGR